MRTRLGVSRSNIARGTTGSRLAPLRRPRAAMVAGASDAMPTRPALGAGIKIGKPTALRPPGQLLGADVLCYCSNKFRYIGWVTINDQYRLTVCLGISVPKFCVCFIQLFYFASCQWTDR